MFIKKIFHFLNKNPISYFIIFAAYGWIVYKYYTVPTELPEGLQRAAMNQNLTAAQLEVGKYYRAKEFNVDKCAELKQFNEIVFCQTGWHYFNYINLIEKHFLPTKKKSTLLVKVLEINEFPKALALGGAIKQLNLEASQLPIEKKWLPYIEEGYGFFSALSMFFEQLKYPLNTLCPSHMNSDFCNFGVGQAAYYIGYDQEEIKYNVMANKGAEFAAVFGDKNRPQNPTPIQQYALALINNNKNKLPDCAKKNHPAACF